MPSSERSAVPASPISRGYKFLRGLVRLWFSLFFRSIRLLRSETLPASSPTVLVISHPASFLDALILIASFERQLRCLLDRRLLAGPLRSLLAWGLGMLPYNPGSEGWPSALEACSNVLAKGEAVVVFAELSRATAAERAPVGLTAATLALEAEARHSGQLGLTLFPVHLFLPVDRSHSGELLIHIGAPQYPRDSLSPGGGSTAESAAALALEVEKALRQNVFGLRGGEFERFLSDLEEVLRSDLEEVWSSQTDWKQKAEGFELSQFVEECAQQLNYLNPGRLVALRERLEAYREARRLWSLAGLEVEQAGPWLKSPWKRVGVWLESIVGVPLACYGLINHILSWLFLFWTGLLKQGSVRDRKLEWLARASVVLGCYGLQLLFCGTLLGRRAAGLYAPSLPLSGLILWRYGWLLGRRTRLAFLSVRLPRQAGGIRRMRKELIQELDKVVHGYAGTLGVAQ